MIIPDDQRKIIQLAKEMTDVSNASLLHRMGAYETYAKYIENGNNSDQQSLANMLFSHNDRLASHLFCPTDARFGVEFEYEHPRTVLLQAEQVGRLLTRAFNRKNFDLSFAGGVRLALDYGTSFVKITGKTEKFEHNGKEMTRIRSASARIIPPWLMGIENEGKNGLENQEFITETVYCSEWDVKRRIAHLPDRDKLWKRIRSHSNKTEGPGLPQSFVQLLSASTINLNTSGTSTTPGGIVQISGDGSSASTRPQSTQDLYPMREIQVWDDDTADYTMIQYIEPDILIAPVSYLKRVNAFCPECQPYLLIQPNEVAGYFWGRAEIIDLMQLQGALSETMSDLRRLIGVQYDKRLAFEGFDGDPQELYEDFMSAGYVNGRAGAKVSDLTPKVPAEAVTYIKVILDLMNDVGGFGNILSGQGEAGVRAGNHAQTLLKTASPRLRDRSLIVERQFAAFGDRYLSYMEAKDESLYYTDADKPDETSFLLSQIPEDRHVMVDSHSSSPIYENDHLQLVAFALKSQMIDPPRAIKMINGFPDKDEALREARERAEAQAKMIQEHPELLSKGRPARK